jgi:hypothetical protein
MPESSSADLEAGSTDGVEVVRSAGKAVTRSLLAGIVMPGTNKV